MNIKEALILVFSYRARLEHGSWIEWAESELAIRQLPEYEVPAPREFPPANDRKSSPSLSAREAQPENLNADFEAFITSNKWVRD